MESNFPTEIGDLLFKNVDQGTGRTIHYHYSSSIENPSFRDALEMYCYRNKLHMRKNPASLFYMIMGYLSTLPQTKQFYRNRMKNVFQTMDGRTIKVVVQYGETNKGVGFRYEDYKAFVIHIDPTTQVTQLGSNDLESLERSISKVYPQFYRPALKSALETTQYISITRPNVGTVYNVLTDDGTKTLLAYEDSPFIVEVGTAPLMEINELASGTYTSVPATKIPCDYQELMNRIPFIFQETANAHGLKSTPENLLSFIQGALEFNYKVNDNLRIRLNVEFFNNNYNKLFVQAVQKRAWISYQPPMVIITRREEDSASYHQDGRLPSDFNSKRTQATVVTFSLSDQGYITRDDTKATIADRESIINQLFRILESDTEPERLNEAIAPIVHMMELDTEFFFARNDQPRSKFFGNYILGQLMAYAGDRSVQIYSFLNAEVMNDNQISLVFRRGDKTSGVALHILEDTAVGQSGTFSIPDYRKIGLNEKILNLYIDCRGMGLIEGLRRNILSRLPAKSIYSVYTYGSNSFGAMTDFRKIDMHFLNQDLYLILALRKDFLSTVAGQAIKAGLELRNSMEQETLIKSFCLGKDERKTFLPYPKEDPNIVGISSMGKLPAILLKSGVDVTQNRLLDDLRSVYMGDQVYPKKRNVIMKVVSTTSSNTEILEEYSNGISGYLYEICANRPLFGRLKRQVIDFCRKARNPEGEGLSGREEDQYQISEEGTQSSEGILQKYAIFRRNLKQHIERVERFSNILMHATMAKNIVGALIDGDYKEVAVNAGFLVGSAGLGYAAKYAAKKGATSAAEGSKMLSTSLRLASSFLARVTSAFVAYDLYKQVKTYKSGNDDALLGVVGDSVVLTIDVAAVVIESLEAFNLIDSVSFAFSPIGAAIGAVIFVSVDVYQAVKTVERINSLIELTTYERFKDGILAFVHASPDQYILDLMKSKQLNNEVAKRAAAILKDMTQFQIYASPTLKLCQPVKSLNICKSGVEEVENNFANFTRLNNFYSRTWPDTPKNFKAICANAGPTENMHDWTLGQSVESWLTSHSKSSDSKRMALECHNFEALFNINSRNGNKAFLKAASGNDSIIGFLDRSNVITFTGGHKYFIGGNKPDTFILDGEDIATGFVDGGAGLDTLDFSKYDKPGLLIQFYNADKTTHFLLVSGTKNRLDIDNVESFIGRPDAQDRIITNCHTSFVNLQGGTDQLVDSISITKSSKWACEYRLAIALWHNTNVWNEACSGKFSYELNKDTKSGPVYLQNYCENDENTAQNIIKTNTPLHGVSKMRRFVVDNSSRLEIQFESGIILSVIDFNLDQTHFLFQDFNVQVGNDGIIGMRKVPVIENPYEAMKSLLDLCHLNAILVVQDENNATKITMGHGRLISNSKNPRPNMVNVNVFSNDLNFEHSILVSGNGTENIFNIKTKCSMASYIASCGPIITSIFLENNKTAGYKDIIDFSDTYHAVRSLNCTVKVTTQFVSRKKLFIQMWMINRQSKNELFGAVTVHNVQKDGIENQLAVIMNVPFYFHFESGSLILKPTPLSFKKEAKLIILQPVDVAQFMSIKLSKTVDDFLTILESNGTHLIFTNLMDPDIKHEEDNLFTLFLANYFNSEENSQLFDTLKLEFNDGLIFNIGQLLEQRRNDVLLKLSKI